MRHSDNEPADPQYRCNSYWSAHGWIGLALVIIFWSLNWSLPGLRTHWGFFPLWLGYCLAVDGLVLRRKGTSLLTRGIRAYVGLFIISSASWWLFEILNWRTQNWSYEGREYFSNLEYVILASLSFSTVMPAVFGTAELVSTFSWIKGLRLGPQLNPTRTALIRIHTVGWIALALLIGWPQYFFPFMWLSIFCILEPMNIWMGNRSIAKYTSNCDWRPVLALSVGCLICGFFWEMWNYFSYPKWIYSVPFVDFLHIFEMPLLGYVGYLPFALELFALYHLVIGLLGNKGNHEYIHLGDFIQSTSPSTP